MKPRTRGDAGDGSIMRSPSFRALLLCLLLCLLLMISLLCPLLLGTGDWVADGPQVLEYMRASGQGRGTWYLNWPGTFGVTRVRLPIHWQPIGTRGANGLEYRQSLPNGAQPTHLNKGA